MNSPVHLLFNVIYSNSKIILYILYNMVRKHKGIHQSGINKGRLKKGFKFTGNKTKQGLPIIKKVKNSKTNIRGGWPFSTKHCQRNGMGTTMTCKQCEKDIKNVRIRTKCKPVSPEVEARLNPSLFSDKVAKQQYKEVKDRPGLEKGQRLINTHGFKNAYVQ